MSADLRQLLKIFNAYECEYVFLNEYDLIIVPIEGKNHDNLLIFISLQEDGKYLKISAENLFKVDQFVEREKIDKTILILSAKYSLNGKYNPELEQISVSLEFPLQENNLTESQFDNYFYHFVDVVDNDWIPILRSVSAGEEYLDEYSSIEKFRLDLEDFYRL